jgi:hypothetical protein
MEPKIMTPGWLHLCHSKHRIPDERAFLVPIRKRQIDNPHHEATL